MKINWFTLIAQIINFLVLMWLLKRFLYKPILSAIDERENKIKVQLNDAEMQKTEATNEREEFKRKNETFDKQKDGMLQKAAADAKVEGDRLKEEARTEANVLKTKLETAFTEDRATKNNEMTKRVQGEVLDIARKTLSDLSSADLEGQMVELFIKKISTLEADSKKKFTIAVSAKTPILVQSAFELSSGQQTEIQKYINEFSDGKHVVQFKVDAELIAGIVLIANDYKFAWNVSDYLKSLENNISVLKSKETKIKKKVN
ncbi:ATP synthase F0 subcomplex B subunit [Pricia antarctica]|uniref:ATP synthase subunit b n=1 Tax=Pricia antarctica TaxID=641691 RepID=A0A1G7D274_9FLAO|nr:F0F1 ATP synthase subunit delta [Pricia antarctica]SDE45026.1 ATP synthase F0 subcomplex B subunit [Pricia antarctica]